jgi:hypothetical protein
LPPQCLDTLFERLIRLQGLRNEREQTLARLFLGIHDFRNQIHRNRTLGCVIGIVTARPQEIRHQQFGNIAMDLRLVESLLPVRISIQQRHYEFFLDDRVRNPKSRSFLDDPGSHIVLLTRLLNDGT